MIEGVLRTHACARSIGAATLRNRILGGPAGGSSPHGLSFATKMRDMACTDVQEIFYRTSAGQIVVRMASGFSKNIFTKMQIFRDPVDRFS